jgi:LmbE family N-acetylglucosaminyl deacetylase
VAPATADRHPDHAAAGRLAREAAFFAGVAQAGEGRPHRVHRVYHYAIHHPVDASFVVDVTAVWSRRMAAVLAYDSQFGHGCQPRTEIGHDEFLEVIEARARYYGAMIGVRYGEPFAAVGPLAADAMPGLPAPPGEGSIRYRTFM